MIADRTDRISRYALLLWIQSDPGDENDGLSQFGEAGSTVSCSHAEPVGSHAALKS